MTVAEIDEVAAQVARRLTERGQTVAVAESAAGGLISAALLGQAGASAYFKGGAVVYNAEAKRQLAGLTTEDLDAVRPSTAPHAAILANSIRERLAADWAIAETGAAGPTGNRYGDAAGHVALAVAGPTERTQVVETGESNRQRNMEAFALAALHLLADTLG
ncbi:MAG: nicotinamide-nucleotide amidase [Chloroflexota bacterium]|jgi:PncC family amidohydrolase|nr:nicotinamide-nucleotide amidase [Chloroflexota bacterium]